MSASYEKKKTFITDTYTSLLLFNVVYGLKTTKKLFVLHLFNVFIHVAV